MGTGEEKSHVYLVSTEAQLKRPSHIQPRKELHFSHTVIYLKVECIITYKEK